MNRREMLLAGIAASTVSAIQAKSPGLIGAAVATDEEVGKTYPATELSTQETVTTGSVLLTGERIDREIEELARYARDLLSRSGGVIPLAANYPFNTTPVGYIVSPDQRHFAVPEPQTPLLHQSMLSGFTVFYFNQQRVSKFLSLLSDPLIRECADKMETVAEIPYNDQRTEASRICSMHYMADEDARFFGVRTTAEMLIDAIIGVELECVRQYKQLEKRGKVRMYRKPLQICCLRAEFMVSCLAYQVIGGYAEEPTES